MSSSYRIQSIFESDIAQTLDRLEALLEIPETPEFATALKTQVAALLSWGEVLGVQELVSLAQTIVMLMRAAPDHNPLIAQLALQGFRAIYRLELLQAQQSQTSLTAAIPNPEPSAYAPHPSEINSELILEQRLTTTNLFIWQMESTIFALPSNQVIEILISKPEQVIQTNRRKSLRWRDQTVPIYQLIKNAAQPVPEITLSNDADTPLKSGTILVIQQGEHTLALDIDIKLLITDSELIILPFTPGPTPPSYCQGYTVRSGEQTIPVINLAILLQQQFRSPVTPTATSPSPPLISVPKTTKKTAPSVLVVDDSHTLRHILTIALENAGYEAIQAEDGTEALKALQRHQEIQLVVCDVEMPNMNGFDFLNHCRRDPKFTDLPVVMLSTYSGEDHRQLSKTLGANAYFSKPYDQNEFLEKLRTLIQEKPLEKN